MTRSRGHSNADGDSTQGVADGIADRLTGRGGALLVTLAMLTVGLTMAPTAIAQDLGDRVVDGDDDQIPVLQDISDFSGDFPGPRVCSITTSEDDEYYLHWDASTCDTVDRRDIRLTDTDGGSAGETVQSGDSDLNNQFDGINVDFISNVGYLEADGLPGFTADDWVYFSQDAFLDATNDDIRLTRTDGGSAGTLVDTSTDSDFEEAADDDSDEYPISTDIEDKGEFGLKVYDVDGDGDFEPDEEPILLAYNDNRDFASINDVSLSGSSDHSYGDVLTESDDKIPRWLIALASTDARLAVTEEVQSPRDDRHLFLHFDDDDGSNDAILADDVALFSDAGSFGDRVTSESDGQGEEIDSHTPFIAEVFWLDTDGDDEYTPDEDPIYLNRPDSLGGNTDDGLSSGDLRMTGFDGFSSGTVVKSDDSDLNAYGDLTKDGGKTGEWKLMLYDGDLTNATSLESLSDGKTSGPDGDWDEDIDGAYDADSSSVGHGDLRLYISPQLANTQLTCVDSGDEEHDDCDTTLFNRSDLRSTSSSFSPSNDAVYHDVDDDETVSNNDYRIYHPDLVEGTVSSNDEDAGDELFDDARIRPDGNFSAGSDNVYYDQDDSENVTDGDVRLWHDWDGSPPSIDSTVNCDDTTYELDCDADLSSDNNIKVTGTDSDYEAGQSEYLYYSVDDILNTADFRFLDYSGDGGQDVADGDADLEQLGVDDNDRLYLSWCEGASSCTHPTNRVRIGDLKLGSGDERIDLSSSDYDVEVIALGTGVSDQSLKRYDRGTSGRITDDTLYLSFSSTSDRLKQDDLRLLPFDSEDAGSRLQSGDSEELSVTVSRDDVDAFFDLVDWADVDGNDGYTEDDPVYLDLTTEIYTDATSGTLSIGDIRLTEVSASGDTFGAGTLVTTGHSDRSAYDLEDSATPSWTLYWHDLDRDGDIDDDEQVYLNPGTGPATTSVPDILSIRLSGGTSGPSGGGGGSGDGGGGGGNGNGDTTEDPVSISISSPTDGETLDHDEDIAISGTASNVDFVSVTVNDTDLVVSGRTSWSATFADPEPGEYTIQATATGEQGGTATDTVTVTVAEPPEPEPVSVVISSPRSGASFGPGEQVDITGFASGDDLDVNVSVDGEDLTVTGTNQFSAMWTTPEDTGDYEITATAIGDGGTATKSVPVSVTDGEPADGDGDGDGNDTEEPEDTPAPGVIAALLAIGAAVLIRRD